MHVCDVLTMLLQDVRDNKTEAANAAPQALRLCQMVGSIAPNSNFQMHYKTSTSSHIHAIVVALSMMAADTVMAADSYSYMVFNSGCLSKTYIAHIFLMSISAVKVICTTLDEQPVTVPAKKWAGVATLCYVPTRITYRLSFLSQWCLFSHKRTAGAVIHFRIDVLEHVVADCSQVDLHSLKCRHHSCLQQRHCLSPLLYMLPRFARFPVDVL